MLDVFDVFPMLHVFCNAGLDISIHLVFAYLVLLGLRLAFLFQ